MYVGRRHAQRGVPNQRMAEDNRAVKLLPSSVPDVSRAKLMYHSNGGSLSPPGIFGCDPLAADPHKSEIRSRAFNSSFLLESIFSDVVNCGGQLFRDAFNYFVDITYRLSISD